MSAPMSHEAAREALEALALDALDAVERAAALAHVGGCETCAAELEALRHAVAELAFAAVPVPMSPAQREGVRARLLTRAGAAQSVTAPVPAGDTGATPVPIAEAPRRRIHAGASRELPRWMTLAAAAVVLVILGSALRIRRDRDLLRESLRLAAVERATGRVTLDSLRAALASRDRMIASLTGPHVAVMTLASANRASPTGMLFWDQTHDMWTFVGHNLPMPKPGRSYQLWLMTPTTKISAGMFKPSSNGEAMLRTTHAMDRSALASVAVTDEPESGSAQPTSAPMLIAKER
jgi:anti-sigma-K factor RskA